MCVFKVHSEGRGHLAEEEHSPDLALSDLLPQGAAPGPLYLPICLSLIVLSFSSSSSSPRSTSYQREKEAVRGG